MPHAANIYRLGVKELWSLARDVMMLVLIAYTFTVSIYVAATAIPETLHKAPIAIVDEDGSPLSERVSSAFYAPRFRPPAMVPLAGIYTGMDAGDYTFALNIPPDFQRDVLAGKSPAIQLNVDATCMTQAFTGSGYIQQMVMGEVGEFVQRYRKSTAPPVGLALRVRFNPNLEQFWFGALMEIINNVTMLSIILIGASLIREREHGTIEHLLVMPVTPAEIMLSKVWSMGLVVRSMPQFGMRAVLILLPLQVLSGGSSPRESMPGVVQNVMLVMPSTHFVILGQSILFRGAGLGAVWPQFLALTAIGAVFFAISLNRFRKTIGTMT